MDEWRCLFLSAAQERWAAIEVDVDDEDEDEDEGVKVSVIDGQMSRRRSKQPHTARHQASAKATKGLEKGGGSRFSGVCEQMGPNKLQVDQQTKLTG